MYHNFLNYLEFAFNPDSAFSISFLTLLTKYLTYRLFSMGRNSLIEKGMSLIEGPILKNSCIKYKLK